MTLENSIKNKIDDIITKIKNIMDSKITNHNTNLNSHSSLFDKKIDITNIRNNLNTSTNNGVNENTVLSAFQGYELNRTKLDKPTYNTAYPDSTYLKQYLSIDSNGNITGAPIFLNKIKNSQPYNFIKEGEDNTLTLTNQELINTAINNKISSIEDEITDNNDNLIREISVIEEMLPRTYIQKSKLKYKNGKLYIDNN